ncbi:uncharacterized protein MYCFIDRAFT_190569 [Pseudocercospora fijiensis CIRAD86]|uniref:Proline dehydrogenase n=1 Tax=Pseudocercospora fijiensis (strain CIRAD86) TaxID=383855 RepID=M2ZL75_PSEFD|nr:uncharacterized protein MYCFIDRAFT_190569 [Pseudocercospora fijiensis CIRAD86]EME79814.1 hypothetical protein MYCFIDRAFT_190569 [Pseudocercospora fijiensis CIRAD86]
MFTSPIMFKAGFTILDTIANSRSKILNPDANPVLRAVVKPLVYDQFCAGTNQKEIFKTRDQIRKMGYAGVILCYGRETVVDSSNKARATGAESAATKDAGLNMWKNGNLATLDMAGSGDWLGIKLTGAGSEAVKALLADSAAPESFVGAMDEICAKARARNCRIWIDSEQSAVQTAIDRWTIDLMRRWNRDGHALVYNTLQAYLKESRSKLKSQLSLADRERWTLAIKLVRGAYIAHDQRSLIHDSKQDTDDSYNSIVRDLLSGTNLGFHPENFPSVQLFLAGHNPESVSRAWNLIQQLSGKGELKVVPDFGQLQGMADELGCKILQRCEELEEKRKAEGDSGGGGGGGGGVVVPRVYRCLTWGSIQECMQYLLRRLVENQGGADRMRDGMFEYYGELKRRVFGRLMGRS